MANLVRTPMRPAATRTGRPSPKTKVVLVRHPVKSVRPSDQDTLPTLRLALWVVAALGATATIWLIGHLGYRLGFAPLMRVPQLADEPIGGLATGVLVLLRVPVMVFEAGLANPVWLMIAFVLIAIPAAGLTAAKPRRPGGPRAPMIVDVFATLGAVGAGLNAVAIVTWLTSPMRQAMVQPLPFDVAGVADWASGLRVAAGLDVLALIVCALWVVLVLRLPVPLWLRAIAATVSIFVLALMTVGTSISNVTATEVHARRSLFLTDGSDGGTLRGSLLLGVTRHEAATLRVEKNLILVELQPTSSPRSVIGTQSVEAYLGEGTDGPTE